jgi:hypothetical protein
MYFGQVVEKSGLALYCDVLFVINNNNKFLEQLHNHKKLSRYGSLLVNFLEKIGQFLTGDFL